MMDESAMIMDIFMTNQINLFHFDNNKPNFEDSGQKNGFVFWSARKLMIMLGYADYAVFKRVINKAITVCMTLDIDVNNNFQQVEDIDGKKNYHLSKFACYLVALNGDVKKPQVAQAQAYFITLTEAFKRYVTEPTEAERVAIRGEVSEREKSLGSLVKESGIENYAFFQNKGFLGLYNMPLKQLKLIKGIPVDRSPLDFMGKEELAANLFRITQTEAKIRNENIKGQINLEHAAFSVGRKIRNTMQEISKTKPEELPAVSDIKAVKSIIKSTHKEFTRKKAIKLKVPESE